VFEKESHEDPKTGLITMTTMKKIGAYHQYYAVRKAVESTLVATGADGSRKGGVAWARARRRSTPPYANWWTRRSSLNR
jgi:type I restriction enzyme R subunit